MRTTPFKEKIMSRKRARLLELLVWLGIVAAAAGARVGYLTTYGDQAASGGPFQVQGERPPLLQGGEVSEDLLAANIREHNWYGSLAPFARQEEQTAHVAPAYPYLVAWAGKLDLMPADQLVRWLQCGLGALATGFYFLFARRAFQNWLVAVLAGLFCALHPFWIINAAELNDGVLTSFLLAAVLYLGMRAGKHGGPLTSFLYGAGLAVLALTRAALLPFSIAALLWLLWRCRTLVQGWLAAALAVLGLVIALTPWTLRNYAVWGDAIPVVTTTYYHLWMGNNPQATGGPIDEEVLLSQARAAYREQSLQPPDFAALPQPQRYQALAGPVSWEIVSDGPGLASRRLWAGLYFFFGEDWFTEHQLYRKSPVPLEQADQAWRSFYPGLLVGALLGMLLLGVLGWRWTYSWRHRSMPASLAVFWIPLPYIMSHAEALSGPRLPLDGVLLTYAAFAIGCLLPGIGRRLLAGASQPVS